MTQALDPMQIAEAVGVMSNEQLRETCKTQGINVRSNATDESMRKAILDNMAANLPNTANSTTETMKELPPQPSVKECTVEEVQTAILPFTNRGLEARFPGDGTWHFRFRGSEDTGSLAMPLKLIRIKAGAVAQGAYVLREEAASEFGGGLGAKTGSEYANKVMGG